MVEALVMGEVLVTDLRHSSSIGMAARTSTGASRSASVSNKTQPRMPAAVSHSPRSAVPAACLTKC